jgi:hypothetical protein
MCFSKSEPKVVLGESYHEELGAARFQWTIPDFRTSLRIGSPLKSPTFVIETSEDPAGAPKVNSFHLEMDMKKKCLVWLVTEEAGEERLTEVSLERY